MTRFGFEVCPCDESCIIVDGRLRISVLSNRILRVELSTDGVFEDRPTQKIMNRNFAKPTFTVDNRADEVSIMTEACEFLVDKLTCAVLVRKDGLWSGAKHGKNLGGTARTLDFTYGRILLGRGILHLGKGIFSTGGVSEIDDSSSYAINEDGTLEGRNIGIVDKYVLAFGKDYLGGLKEFYELTGKTPLLPKYALGNWWSRYYRYRQDEYVELMDKFATKNMPITVATIDMDWHLVDNVPKDVEASNPMQGRGWTGYTFEKNFFPDYKKFFNDLKSRGLAITMNLHPRDGVRYFEEQYADMARANGIDPATKKSVEFDFTDMRFVESYFDILLHPYESDGVDFWWVDWQQGTKSKLPGLDPLWLLNHYHTLDAGREGRTPLLLSRYAGVGSHRYPIGFSGDTVVAWACLRLQPYFTSNAANIGYGWWSHDIGGHMFGHGNDELYIRWLQFGVFSPINRLHSNNKSWSKEPWLYGERAEKIAGEFLRLRHRLLPYLYTANVIASQDGAPLVAPMYYYDDTPQAYKAQKQYYFGTQMVVAPVLSKAKCNGKAKTEVYLPTGGWTDFFTGERFEGGNKFEVYSSPETIPVFVADGSIIPLIAEREGNSLCFDALEVRVYKGSGSYTMYDEKGKIEFAVEDKDGKCSLSVKPSADCETKKIKVVFVGVDCKKADVSGKEVDFSGGIEIDCKECVITV